MPGPGGGGRSGGGGRGGSFGGGGGGGFGGGGRGGAGRPGGGFPGGPPHRPHPRPFMGWGWGRRYYGGGGCLGGLMGMILLPVVLVVLVIALIFGGLTNGIQIQYSEEDFQDFASKRYMQHFGSEKDYEDQLLLVVLVEDDEYYDFNYIAWTGDHVNSRINNMLGNDYTELGALMTSNIANNYKYSLSRDLASVFDGLTEKVTDLKLESSFTCTTEHANAYGKLVNESKSLDMNQDTVETALNNFATETGISVVLLVADQDEVLPTSYTGLIVAIVLIAAIAIIAIVLINKKKKPTDDGDRYQPNGRY